MNSRIIGLRMASILFGLMTVGQLTRLFVRPEIIVEGYVFPLWPSAVAVVVLGGLCLWLWHLSRG
ncbi:MAG: hypothetical protein M0P04_04425 [Syntrophales bacterium]|jgi:hypothetical protein|nr:hypothetical protein [Syntrophales bacterium]MDD4338374.1 hypothetical protein [Syntrophales bacterium]HOG06802.1 hypothetical protein [Syntrophales bacterium]HOS77163.1 hypothetical protein [Syntrophales bacterium]HPB70198.1 hypothetical protein [Syntrophales bacterium]